jgi:hypothetical protein
MKVVVTPIDHDLRSGRAKRRPGDAQVGARIGLLLRARAAGQGHRERGESGWGD